jgi:hypothetical protein
MAMTACSAKFLRSSICLSVKGGPELKKCNYCRSALLRAGRHRRHFSDVSDLVFLQER